jgi:hypothetical protein
MAELAIISAIATAAGSVMQAQGTIAAGKAAQQSAEFEAQQLDIKAKEEQAAAQREAFEHKRKTDLTLSELQSRAATSGFTATDPTALALADEISRYGTYQQQMAQYGGASRRAGTQAQAGARRMEGRAARKAAGYSAAGTILGGISSIAGNYGKQMPSSGGSYRYS